MTGLAVAANGSIVAAGDAGDSSGVTTVFVLRVTPSGAPDATFGSNGQAAVAALDPVSPTGGLDRKIGFASSPMARYSSPAGPPAGISAPSA